MGGLRQATLRRTASRPRLSRALHPPRRDLERPAHRARRGGRDLQMEGLPDQRPRPAQNHDARRRRVLPPLSPARAALRFPSHPPLRPVRQRRSRTKHRARPPMARRAQGLAPKRARRGRQRDQNTFARAPMPLLRRPDDHHRNLRRPAPRAFPTTKPDQDRHLMIITALPASQPGFSSPPAARRSRKPMSSRGRQSSSDRRARARPAHTRDQTRLPSSVPPPRFARHQPATNASRPDPKISIGRARPNGVPSYPRFPPWEAFERRPQNPYDRPANGRRPKPFTIAEVKRPILLRGGTRILADALGSHLSPSDAHRRPIMSASDAIRQFHVNFPEAELTDLRKRVNATKWPERETVADATQGVQLATIQKLADYWGTGY